MRIAVIGAGIGGLATARGLQADGHEVLVLERRADASPVGAGLTLFPNAMEALDVLGLGDEVREVSCAPFRGMRCGQRDSSGAWLVSLPAEVLADVCAVHRADLHRVLREGLAPGTLRCGAFAEVAPDGSPRVTVGNSTERFDVVIAADGIHSQARVALGLDRGVRHTGALAWRGVTSSPVDLGGQISETWGPGGIVGYVPLPDDRIYWYVTMSSPSNPQIADERAALREHVGTWCAPIPQLIDATTDADLMRHDLHDLAAIPECFHRGQVALLGDAAHAMTPHLGQGAGQALEDAASLVTLLGWAGEYGAEGIDAALTQYTRIRRPRARSVWSASRTLGRLAQAEGVAATAARTLLRMAPSWVMAASSCRIQRWPRPERNRR